ncbi:MAG: hypothetical protein KAQ98_02930 [Bacteriovoracaceae bacterium]|nr:hypothetical protein [Bacteriovoracaceae bacterium]
MKTGLIFVFILVSFFTFAQTGKKSVSEIIKFSTANFRGQKALYNDGWLIIPSTQKSLEYCHERSIGTAKEAWLEVMNKASDGSNEFYQSIRKKPEHFKRAVKFFHKYGKKGRKWINKKTDKIVSLEYEYSRKNFKKAWDSILIGTIHMNDLVHDDWERLKAIPVSYPSRIKNDFKKLKEMVSFLRSKKKNDIEVSWSDALSKARLEWNSEYEKSGRKKNTLVALPYVLWGHVKALWYGLIKPAGEEIEKKGTYTGKKTMKWIGKGVLFPVAGVVIISGRTIFSLGGIIYYTTKIGVKIIAKTVEGGLLASVSMLSVASTAPTWVAGKTAGAMNQVALSTSGVVGGASFTTLAAAGSSTRYAGQLLYLFGKETGKLISGTTVSGVVLGYNALTQLPVQTFLTAVNGTVFLVYDGPKLFLAYANGDIAGSSVTELPVGSVVNMKELDKRGVKVKILTEDEKVIQKVLKKLPYDLNGSEK